MIASRHLTLAKASGEKMSAETLLRKTVQDPASMGINERQATKLLKRISRINRSAEKAISMTLEVARQRAERSAPTIYIASAGSSGSHWAQSIFASLAPMLECGEVYLPDRLLKNIGHLERGEQIIFMNSYYVVHGWSADESALLGPAINTAHKPDPRTMSAFDAEAVLILLLRDPLDVVMSRTFRKEEYRSAIGHGSSNDDAYLEVNISYVKNFYSSIDKSAFDTVIRYEDLRHHPESAIRIMAEAAGIHASQGEVVKSAAESKGESGAFNNLYSGPRVDIPQHLYDAAERSLLGIRSEFGY